MSDSETILYDIPAKDGKPWSYNPWKSRLVLNYKKIPYKTQWLEYPDIAPVLRSKGIAPAADDPPYTIPAIKFRGTHIMDSKAIARALEAAHPEPSLGLDDPINARLLAAVGKMHAALYPMWMATVGYALLGEASRPYFVETRTKRIGRPLADAYAEVASGTGEKVDAMFKEAQEGIRETAALIRENAAGPYLLGEKLNYADIVLVSCLQFYRRVSEEHIFGRLVREEPVFLEYYNVFKPLLAKDD